jgi:hypothetical protein
MATVFITLSAYTDEQNASPRHDIPDPTRIIDLNDKEEPKRALYKIDISPPNLANERILILDPSSNCDRIEKRLPALIAAPQLIDDAILAYCRMDKLDPHCTYPPIERSAPNRTFDRTLNIDPRARLSMEDK